MTIKQYTLLNPILNSTIMKSVADPDKYISVPEAGRSTFSMSRQFRLPGQKNKATKNHLSPTAL